MLARIEAGFERMMHLYRGIAMAAVVEAVTLPALAQMPMSPADRTAPASTSRPAAQAPSAAPKAAPAAPKEADESKTEEPASPVASAPIPPPPVAEPATVETKARSASAPAEKVAVARPSKRHVQQRRYMYSRYRAYYRPAESWPSAWRGRSAPYYGPNPYSPNGGE